MTPILGIMASAMSANLAPLNGFVSIATQTVGAGGASSVTFSSIPSVYKHLQIRAIAKYSLTNLDQSNFIINCNSDTSSSYSYHRVWGTGAAVQAAGGASLSAGYLQTMMPSNHSSSTNMFGSTVVDFLDYQNTNKFKTVRALGGYDRNGSGIIALASFVWQKTDAISSITITPDSDAWMQYSQFALYGIEG